MIDGVSIKLTVKQMKSIFIGLWDEGLTLLNYKEGKQINIWEGLEARMITLGVNM